VSNQGGVRNTFQKESHSDIVILLLLEWCVFMVSFAMMYCGW
jgi:hypothetical protein